MWQLLLHLFIVLITAKITFAQSNNAPSSYDPHEIKITGYLQVQFQGAQSPGIVSFSGGDFSANSNSRFMIRRGRLKIDRVDKYSSIVLQIDATQDGVQLMDAFVQLNHPSWKALSLTAGLFNRPFGYSIVYSSGYRDFPERARVFQTLMPRERDLGILIGYRPMKIAEYLTLELAMVNGSGKSAKDYDTKKDIIGNIGFQFDSLYMKKFHIGFGASIYKGSVRNNTKTYFISNNSGYISRTSDSFIGKNLARTYYGVNLQLQYDNSFGSTSFKTEYVVGKQPGVAAGGADELRGPYASQSFGIQPIGDLFVRNFNGYYFWFTQQIGKSKFKALIAYDVYDPNTKIGGKMLGAAENFTNDADVKFNTLGYGLSYQLSQRLKLTVYFEKVKNESTSLEMYEKDIPDNVLTTRLLYRW